MTCDGCGQPSSEPRCADCVRYYRDLKRRGSARPCRCDNDGCNECADRGQAIADAKETR